MSGYRSVLFIRGLEQRLNELGFVMDSAAWYGDRDQDLVSIKPKDDESLPVYSRDAEVFIGTLEQLEVWIRGVEWARSYDQMLGVSNDKKRQRKEQDTRNRLTMQRLKASESTQQ